MFRGNRRKYERKIKMTIYADNAATTKMCREAIEAMLPYMDKIYGNPSSLHSVGLEAAHALAGARETVAECLGCSANEITFTSGGSEADNQALFSAAELGAKKGKKHIISTAFEHHAILHTLKKLESRGFEVELLPVGETGTVTAAQVAAALAEFVGEIEQLPPMYSAVSVNGKRLYDLARQGVEVEREPRRVTVYSAEILEANESAGEYAVSVECSSGTYIRTLISDLGEKLGCGAVLTELRRTAANGFKIDSAVTLDALSQAAESGELDRLIIPVDRALEEYPIITVSAAQARRFGNGGELSLERLKYPRTLGLFRIYDPDGAFMGLGEIGDGDSLKVKRVFVG